MAIKDELKTIKVAKPFVKWAGGKGSLVKLLSTHLPDDFCKQDSITYITPVRDKDLLRKVPIA